MLQMYYLVRLMASKVAIWNMALVNIGSSAFIQSPTEASAEADHLRAVWDAALDTALESLDWNFARVKLALSDLSTPDDDWLYQYAYPSNCVKARKILTTVRNEKPLPFSVGLNAAGTAKVINTDVQEAVLVYTRRITDTLLFSSAFVTALSWQLATQVAGPLAGNDKQVIDKTMKGLAAALSQAQALEKNEGQQDDPQDASWIREYE